MKQAEQRACLPACLPAFEVVLFHLQHGNCLLLERSPGPKWRKRALAEASASAKVEFCSRRNDALKLSAQGSEHLFALQRAALPRPSRAGPERAARHEKDTARSGVPLRPT